jgi:hypothetical protein
LIPFNTYSIYSSIYWSTFCHCFIFANSISVAFYERPWLLIIRLFFFPGSSNCSRISVYVSGFSLPSNLRSMSEDVSSNYCNSWVWAASLSIRLYFTLCVSGFMVSGVHLVIFQQRLPISFSIIDCRFPLSSPLLQSWSWTHLDPVSSPFLRVWRGWSGNFCWLVPLSRWIYLGYWPMLLNDWMITVCSSAAHLPVDFDRYPHVIAHFRRSHLLTDKFFIEIKRGAKRSIERWVDSEVAVHPFPPLIDSICHLLLELRKKNTILQHWTDCIEDFPLESGGNSNREELEPTYAVYYCQRMRHQDRLLWLSYFWSEVGSRKRTVAKCMG